MPEAETQTSAAGQNVHPGASVVGAETAGRPPPTPGRWPSWRAPALVGVGLALLSFFTFRGIYTGKLAFPWDFGLAYHALPFYWQAMVKIGRFPEWMPYQAVGFPLQLTGQSGLYYPPLWLFVLCRIVFSVQAVASFQCLHVLAAALGTVWLARLRGLSWLGALLAGAAYHLFGGFFCNAEHPDIVRGYALLPLLLAGLTLAENRSWRWPPARLWSIPLVTLCLATGVYPGQVPPVIAAAGLYLAAQVVADERARWWERAKQAAGHLVMVLLGLLLALPNLGPTLLLKSEIDRASGRIAPAGMTFGHLFTTLFGYDTPLLPGDISMQSFFVTVPILAGLFFVPWSALRRQRAVVAVFLAAALLIPAGFIYNLAIRLLPPLGYSRFPIADYRALVALPVVLLGALGLEHRLRRETSFSWLDIARVAALLGFLVVGAERFRWRTLPSPQIRDLTLVLVGVAVVFVLARVPRLPRAALMLVMVLLICADGGRMHGLVRRTWQSPAGKVDYLDAKQAVQRSARTERAARPARDLSGWVLKHRYPPNLAGYLRGEWVADDYAVTDHLRYVFFIRNDPALASYVYGASHPKLIAPAPKLAPAEVAARPDEPALGSATPVGYAAEKVVYDITAAGESILVENEPAFAGWRGVAHCEGPGPGLEARMVPELWPLRAWRLPAGHYRFCATYRLPGLRVCLVISGLAMLAWLLGGIVFWWRYRVARSGRKSPSKLSIADQTCDTSSA